MKHQNKCVAFARTLAITLAVTFTGPVIAQEAPALFPSKALTIIVALAAGGAADVEARLYCQKLSENLGRPCLVDFKPGAGTTLGTAYVVKSKPDGYTLLAISPSLTIAPAFHKDLPYDVNRDLTAITQMSKRATLLVINPAFPAKNMAEFVAHMKANPGQVNWGTVGAGSISHLLGAWLQYLTKTQMTIIHYKGASPMNVDIMAGRIHASALTFLGATPLIKAGKLRALGLSSTERSPLLSDLPTVQEQGIPDFEYPSWLSLFGPAGMPQEIVAKLHSEFVRIANSPDVSKLLQADGSTMVGGSSEQLKKLVATETERWRKLVQEAGIKSDD